MKFGRFGRVASMSILALMLAGCGGSIERTSVSSSNRSNVLEGRPVSVAQTYGQCVGAFAMVVNSRGEEVLGSTFSNGRIIAYAQADALVQAQIAKGTNGFVRLQGSYNSDGTFGINSIEAGGYRVGF